MNVVVVTGSAGLIGSESVKFFADKMDIVVGIEKTNYLAIENRSEAIRLALKMAEPGDVVVLAGKGHETYQIIGHKKYPFDEKEIIKEIIDGQK